MARRGASSETYERIYATVRSIPRGRVATYGQVAALSGYGGQARLVGYALHALDAGSTTPWHRVINARGRISSRGDGHAEHVQRVLLQEEGVTVDSDGRVSLDAYRWRPRRRAHSRRAPR